VLKLLFPLYRVTFLNKWRGNSVYHLGAISLVSLYLF